MIKRSAGLITMLLLLAALLPAVAQDQAAEFSEAEQQLWMTDQLGQIDRPTVLRYQFEKSGSLEAGFTDDVTFTVSAVNKDGTKAAALKFFNGERNFPVPPVDRTNVNPILKVYLQGDVYEMNRLSDPNGGASERWRYFQRRIKFALAESAEVTPYQFEFDGRTWNGQKITFQPYTNDPKRNHFERYADKRYTFVVCDDLPGYLYEIETVIPDGAQPQPLLREHLRLSEVRPAAE